MTQTGRSWSQGIIKPVSRTNQALPKVFRSRFRHPPRISIASAATAMDREETMSQVQAFKQDTPTHPSATAAIPDLAALKNRQQAAWSSGDYAVVGTTLQIVGEQHCETLDLRAVQKVLDVT